MIGIGWITVLGEWLSRAGALGATAGFALGGLVMAGVAACYAELMGLMPLSGGDVVFAERVFGRATASIVGWCLVLVAVSVASFEALSFVWVTETLFPQIGRISLYSILGETITAQQLGLGFAVLLLMYFFNLVGVHASARAQSLLTATKLAVMAGFVGVGVIAGDFSKLTFEGVHEGSSWVTGMLWIAGTCAFWLGGFQVISQAVEERSSTTSVRTVALITVGAVVLGLLFYVGVVIAAASSAPRDLLVASPLPAARAAEQIFSSLWGARAVLLAGLCGIVATLNAMLISGSRVLLALARIGYLPANFGRPDGRGVPAFGLFVVTALAGLGICAGKGLLIPVVNTASMSLIASYVLVCVGVLRLRRLKPTDARPFRVPGGRALLWCITLATIAMAIFIIVEPALSWRGFPVEWLLSLLWIGAGFVLWLARRALVRSQHLTGQQFTSGV
jgi:amino acid transporter